MRATVFGASGFIGRYVVKRLAARGAVVVAAVRHPDAALFLKPMGDVGQVAPVRAAVTEEAAVAAAVAGSDVVVNLVGILYEHGAQTFEAVHHQGAGRVARLAKAAGVGRLIHVSAIGADPAAPSAYARSKGLGEVAVRAAFPEATILRPSIVFGPEDDFFNRFAAMARMVPALPLIGGGHTRFQPVYVADVADAVLRAIDDPAAAGRTYELGGPRAYSFAELMRLLLATIGRRRCLVTLPFAIARLQARLLELLPVPPLTRDQVTLLERDNVVATGMPGLAELGIEPTSVEAILPTYLDRFRRGNAFAQRHYR
ncbi:MAG: complex I NDUFA9 subunit family protein [Alphaproteobacteria bacterium]|nr:complex I NDUFA9 subunit family protein [Alphaproteobacteria bacterium]